MNIDESGRDYKHHFYRLYSSITTIAFHSLMSILNYLGFSLAQRQRGTIVIGNWLIDVLKKWTGRCMGFIVLCEKKHRQLIK